MKFLWSEIQLKQDNLDVWLLSIETKNFWNTISRHGSFNINMHERWWGYLGIWDFYALEMQDGNTAKSLYSTLIKEILV